jgi:putative tricarboxylic transport membrane protein
VNDNAQPPSTHEAGPRPRTLAGIGAALVALGAALWIDAAALPPPSVMGVGPSAAPRLVGLLLAGLGVAHFVSAWRLRGMALRVDRGNQRSLAWVMAALIGLIGVLQVGGGFVMGSAWLFVATARAFGERLRWPSVALGFGLSLAVYVFFTKVLSLALPAGPLERLLLG